MNNKRGDNFFTRNNKGISDIIVTVIMVGLVLAAIAVVWFVINNLIGQGVKGIDLGGKCLGITVAATGVTCPNPSTVYPIPNTCTVTLERTGTGTDAIVGVKFVFKNATLSSSQVIDVPGNIEVLAGKTLSVDSNSTAAYAPNKVGVTVYFKDASGKDSLCTQANTFSF